MIVTHQGLPLSAVESVFRSLLVTAAVVKVRYLVERQLIDVAWTQADPEIAVGYLTFPASELDLSEQAFGYRYAAVLKEMAAKEAA